LSWLGAAGVAAAAGVAGWVLENATSPAPRYSSVLGAEARVPFLPIYAAGGAAVALLAPRVRDRSWLVRGALYAAVLGGLEAGAGLGERALGRRSWDYDGATVDPAHAAAWGALALLAEPVVLGATRSR
jgi:hypothetical protein